MATWNLALLNQCAGILEDWYSEKTGDLNALRAAIAKAIEHYPEFKVWHFLALFEQKGWLSEVFPDPTQPLFKILPEDTAYLVAGQRVYYKSADGKIEAVVEWPGRIDSSACAVRIVELKKGGGIFFPVLIRAYLTELYMN